MFISLTLKYFTFSSDKGELKLYFDKITASSRVTKGKKILHFKQSMLIWTQLLQKINILQFNRGQKPVLWLTFKNGFLWNFSCSFSATLQKYISKKVKQSMNSFYFKGYLMNACSHILASYTDDWNTDHRRWLKRSLLTRAHLKIKKYSKL